MFVFVFKPSFNRVSPIETQLFQIKSVKEDSSLDTFKTAKDIYTYKKNTALKLAHITQRVHTDCNDITNDQQLAASVVPVKDASVWSKRPELNHHLMSWFSEALKALNVALSVCLSWWQNVLKAGGPAG